MTAIAELDRIAIDVKSHRLLEQLLGENPRLDQIMRNSRNEIEALEGVRRWVSETLEESPEARAFRDGTLPAGGLYDTLKWGDIAAIRILDYLDHANEEYEDLNLQGEIAVSNPIKLIWLATHFGTGGAKPFFFEDMLHLFRQFSGREERNAYPAKALKGWINRFPAGTDPRIVKLREENRERILRVIIDGIERGEIHSNRFRFAEGSSGESRFAQAMEWWKDHRFHLGFAVRSPALLNEMLGFSLDPDTLRLLEQAQARGIPFFINPYYLSLLHVRVPYFAIGADLAIRQYVLYSEELVREFGRIIGWEKEDLVRAGEPNAAGWLLPEGESVHRRYPDVAILIPDTVGRACGGLCSSCQRMYDFQRGHLNFDLERLRPGERWPDKLQRLMDYFEEDSQLRDVLITGGDALMSSDRSLREVLEAIYRMAERKREANRKRPDGEKYAEIVRVRLGTRLPVYIPQRITPELTEILSDFKEKASKIGIRQFVVQTHFEASMEITPESRQAVSRLLSAGWTVTNQLVMTAAASRRGHSIKLRKNLNDIGVLPYYTFVVKGYMENHANYAPIARIVQEEMEEKVIGRPPDEQLETLRAFPLHARKMVENIDAMRERCDIPFLATDRSVLNLPGVGKSLTFRVIGITRYGRRILQFDHDPTRPHSPITQRMGKVTIIESKSISGYLRQLEEMGENPADYANLYGYSIGLTEPRMPLYEYPPYPFSLTGEMTNLKLG